MVKSRHPRDFWLEVRRQAAHVAGIGNIFAVMIWGLHLALLGLAAQIVFFAGISLYLMRYPRGWISSIVYRVEREREHPFSGAFYWAVGAFLALVLFPQNAAFAGIAVLGVADAASTLIGKYRGKHRLPVNRSKTWEGSVASFFTAAVVLEFFINPVWGIAIAAVVALVEMIPKVNDNLTIPVATAALVTLLM